MRKKRSLALRSFFIFIFRKSNKFLNLRNKPPCYIYYSDTFYLTFGVFCSCNDYFGISVFIARSGEISRFKVSLRLMSSHIKQELDYDDLGRSFYKRLTSVSPIKLIDFDTPSNNVFHCTGEFTCRRDGEEFRPDITLFVNGLPLVFLEVKKPNNKGGMIAEAIV